MAIAKNLLTSLYLFLRLDTHCVVRCRLVCHAWHCAFQPKEIQKCYRGLLGKDKEAQEALEAREALGDVLLGLEETKVYSVSSNDIRFATSEAFYCLRFYLSDPTIEYAEIELYREEKRIFQLNEVDVWWPEQIQYYVYNRIVLLAIFTRDFTLEFHTYTLDGARIATWKGPDLDKPPWQREGPWWWIHPQTNTFTILLPGLTYDRERVQIYSIYGECIKTWKVDARFWNVIPIFFSESHVCGFDRMMNSGFLYSCVPLEASVDQKQAQRMKQIYLTLSNEMTLVYASGYPEDCKSGSKYIYLLFQPKPLGQKSHELWVFAKDTGLVLCRHPIGNKTNLVGAFETCDGTGVQVVLDYECERDPELRELRFRY
jgi:hypothetical protein